MHVGTVDMLSKLSTCCRHCRHACRDWRQAHQSNVLHSGGSPHISAVLWELSTCMSELSTCCRNCRHAVGTVDMLVGTVDMHVGTVDRHIKVMSCTTGGSPHSAAVLWELSTCIPELTTFSRDCRHACRNCQIHGQGCSRSAATPSPYIRACKLLRGTRNEKQINQNPCALWPWFYSVLCNCCQSRALWTVSCKNQR
jgi:hypothetical protein